MDGALQFVALANIVIIASLLTMWLFDLGFKPTQLRNAYKLRLNLAIAALSVAALPIVLAPVAGIVSSSLRVNATDIVVAQYLKGNIALSATQVSEILSAKSSFVETLVSTSSSVSFAIVSIFLAGLVARSIYIGVNVLRVGRIVSHAERLRATKRVEILVSDRTKVPFSTRGLRRYFIVLPRTIIDDRRAAQIAVGHEAEHVRQGDVDWEILFAFASPFFVLNPAYWLILDRIRRYREYSCDAIFLRRSRFDAREYCLLLLEIAATATRGGASRKSTALAGSVSFIGREGLLHGSSRGSLRRRVMALTSGGGNMFQSGAIRFVNIVPAALMVVMMAFTVSVFARPADWSQDRLMLSTVVNLERLDRINAFGVQPLN